MIEEKYLRQAVDEVYPDLIGESKSEVRSAARQTLSYVLGEWQYDCLPESFADTDEVVHLYLKLLEWEAKKEE